MFTSKSTKRGIVLRYNLNRPLGLSCNELCYYRITKKQREYYFCHRYFFLLLNDLEWRESVTLEAT